jgi:hypothetical protein
MHSHMGTWPRIRRTWCHPWWECFHHPYDTWRQHWKHVGNWLVHIVFLLSYWTIKKNIVQYATTLRVQVKMFTLLMKNLSTIIWTFKVWVCCLVDPLARFGCFPSESLFHTMAMAT